MSNPKEARVAVVTGAGGGLGSVMTLALARGGLRVAAVDVSAEALGRLRRLAAQSGVEALLHAVPANLGASEGCAEAIRGVLAELGRIDILVNNAGVGMGFVDPDYGIKPARFWENDAGAWQRMLDINLRAPLLLAQAAVPHMLERKWGRIVNVTTSFNTMLMPAVWAYGQTKAALEAGSASWAKMLEGSGVTVNVLIPGGPVDTPILSRHSTMPKDRLIRAEVMDAPIRWLASEAADGFSNRRLVAAQWNAELPPREAAERCSAPIAWPGFGAQAAKPG